MVDEKSQVDIRQIRKTRSQVTFGMEAERDES